MQCGGIGLGLGAGEIEGTLSVPEQSHPQPLRRRLEVEVAYLAQGFLLGVELTLRAAVASPIPSSGALSCQSQQSGNGIPGTLPITIIIVNSRTVATGPGASGMQPVVTSLLNAQGNG